MHPIFYSSFFFISREKEKETGREKEKAQTC